MTGVEQKAGLRFLGAHLGFTLILLLASWLAAEQQRTLESYVFGLPLTIFDVAVTLKEGGGWSSWEFRFYALNLLIDISVPAFLAAALTLTISRGKRLMFVVAAVVLVALGLLTGAYMGGKVESIRPLHWKTDRG